MPTKEQLKARGDALEKEAEQFFALAKQTEASRGVSLMFEELAVKSLSLACCYRITASILPKPKT